MRHSGGSWCLVGQSAVPRGVCIDVAMVLWGRWQEGGGWEKGVPVGRLVLREEGRWGVWQMVLCGGEEWRTW